MTKKYALKRIHNEVEKRCLNETIATKLYIEEVVYYFFKSLELDPYEEESSSENLKFSISVNLVDEFEELLLEARKEAR